ncbi:hypothetical protein CALVIDRAFT_254967 [Calocera viscosa TUFC12733]|uniref:Uncharacterized protein n=1 Tax=Calocera viscosa (strain TUFC12733) TaxID=1330018 RepID=A0A167J8J0_CALVF|nr:hypothetical protein CALVIDRAFT_254967 [Calocera viscosa TUFC12733]
MPVPIRSASPPPERVMPRQLQGLVDTCLEEGHYLSAFSTLDSIRTQRYRPSQKHLQQLLYIALYPPAERMSPWKRRRLSQPLGSPSKMSREPVPIPTADDSFAAVKLLHSFRITNTAEACALALPVLQERRSRDQESDDEDDDSRIARSAAYMGRARSAWELLRPGTVKRLGEEYVARRGEEEEEGGILVADHAVPVLEWMIDLWEGDAAAHIDQYSRLLLSQLPPPPNPNMPIMGTHSPLNIISYLLAPLPDTRQDGELWRPSRFAESTRRANLASRLLSLLVACTLPSPPPLSPASLLRQTSYILPDVGPSALELLLTTLRPLDASQTAAYSRFKIALSALYLAHTSRNASSDGLFGASPARKAIIVARRRPRALGRGDDTSSTTTDVAASSASVQDTTGRVYPIPSPKTILPMFPLEPKAASSSKVSSRSATPPLKPSLTAKTEADERHRIAKLCILRALQELDVHQLPIWKDAIGDGEVREAVEEWKMGDLTWELAARMLKDLEGKATMEACERSA